MKNNNKINTIYDLVNSILTNGQKSQFLQLMYKSGTDSIMHKRTYYDLTDVDFKELKFKYIIGIADTLTTIYGKPITTDNLKEGNIKSILMATPTAA